MTKLIQIHQQHRAKIQMHNLNLHHQHHHHRRHHLSKTSSIHYLVIYFATRKANR